MYVYVYFFFCNVTATTEIYTLSLHDALPICFLTTSCSATPARDVRIDCPSREGATVWTTARRRSGKNRLDDFRGKSSLRSEEHTSELQSQSNLVCRLLLEKKKKKKKSPHNQW